MNKIQQKIFNEILKASNFSQYQYNDYIREDIFHTNYEYNQLEKNDIETIYDKIITFGDIMKNTKQRNLNKTYFVGGKLYSVLAKEDGFITHTPKGMSARVIGTARGIKIVCDGWLVNDDPYVYEFVTNDNGINKLTIVARIDGL